MNAICRRYQFAATSRSRTIRNSGTNSGKPGRRCIPRSTGSIPARSRSTSSMTWWCAPNASANDPLPRNILEGQHAGSDFGHIGNGNAHITPLLDVNDRQDFDKMVQAYHEIHQTVLSRFDGSICGEHGDGGCAPICPEDVRRGTLSTLRGGQRTIRPANVMNPGIKISDAPFTDHIDYQRLSKSCATCASNSVCPVYDVFQSEDMSSRGWYEIVTAKDYSI